jgi:hypothetical protein
MMLYYRFASTADATYDAMRLAGDARLGISSPQTCIASSSAAPRDQEKRALLAIDEATAVYAAITPELAAMLAAGTATEITQAEYFASFEVAVAESGAAVAVSTTRRFQWVSPYSYMGLAPYGSLESAAVWTIHRTTVSSAGEVMATATATSTRGTDRLTATYS